MKISGDALYVGGAFDEIGGVARPRLAKVSLATGQVDASWAPFTGSERGNLCHFPEADM